MFRYYETYTVDVIRYFDENEIKKVIDDYKEFLEDNLYNDDIDSFSDFIIENFDKEYRINYSWNVTTSWDCEDSNIEEFYREIKKYM